MGERNFGEWLMWFEQRSGEKLKIPPGFNLEFSQEKGFVFWRQVGEVLMIDQSATDDWAYWGKWLIAKGLSLGCTSVQTLVRREPESYARLTGGKIVERGVDWEGRKVARIEWKKIPQLLEPQEFVRDEEEKGDME